MIKITKPPQPPTILSKKGKPLSEDDCKSYTSNKADYNSGARTFEFNSKVYRHKSVKEALVKAQHQKCCYCEGDFKYVAYGDVEHFRPKKGFKQKDADPLGRPGYYWLAYEWSNLFLSCEICNQRYKKNLFPLKDPDKRARSHENDLAREEPLFANPAGIPEKSISFRQEVPYAINGNPIGKATIKGLGLDRPDLMAKRQDHLAKMIALKTLADNHPDDPDANNARELLEKSTHDSAEFASMMRAALR